MTCWKPSALCQPLTLITVSNWLGVIYTVTHSWLVDWLTPQKCFIIIHFHEMKCGDCGHRTSASHSFPQMSVWPQLQVDPTFVPNGSGGVIRMPLTAR